MRYFILFLVVLFNFAGVTLAQDVPDTNGILEDGITDCNDINVLLDTTPINQSIIDEIITQIGHPCFVNNAKNGAALLPGWEMFQITDTPQSWHYGDERSVTFVQDSPEMAVVMNPAKTLTLLGLPEDSTTISGLTNWESWAVWSFGGQFYGAVDSERWTATEGLELSSQPVAPSIDFQNNDFSGQVLDGLTYYLLPNKASIQYEIGETGRTLVISHQDGHVLVEEPPYSVLLDWDVPKGPAYLHDYSHGILLWQNSEADIFVAMPDWAAVDHDQRPIIAHTEELTMDRSGIQCLTFQKAGDLTSLVMFRIEAYQENSAEVYIILNGVPNAEGALVNYSQLYKAVESPWTVYDPDFSPNLFYKVLGEQYFLGWNTGERSNGTIDPNGVLDNIC